jgi:hypothetical protein
MRDESKKSIQRPVENGENLRPAVGPVGWSGDQRYLHNSLWEDVSIEPHFMGLAALAFRPGIYAGFNGKENGVTPVPRGFSMFSLERRDRRQNWLKPNVEKAGKPASRHCCIPNPP